MKPRLINPRVMAGPRIEPRLVDLGREDARARRLGDAEMRLLFRAVDSELVAPDGHAGRRRHAHAPLA